MKKISLSWFISSTLLTCFFASRVLGEDTDVRIAGNPVPPATIPLSTPGNVHPYTISVTAECANPTTINIVRLYGANGPYTFDTPPWNLKGWYVPPANSTFVSHTWNNANYATGSYYWIGQAKFYTPMPPYGIEITIFTTFHYGPYTTY